MLTKALVRVSAIFVTLHPFISTALADLPTLQDEIIVEGLRLPSLSSETGTSVAVITAKDIELRGYAFAIDAIAAAPGVTINQNGAFGGLATVRIRGASSDQTLVLLDGVPLGDPTAVGGGYDFSILDPAEIERIEILKGPQSTLWGSDAIGGVINIISKRHADGLGGSLFAEGGSYDTFRGGAALTGANDFGDLRLSISGITSNGISKADENDGNTEPDAYEGLAIGGRGGINFPHGIKLDTVARYMKGQTDIDGFPPPNFALADTEDNSETEQATGAATLRVPLFNGQLLNLLMLGYTDIERRGNFGGFESFDEGDRLILRYQGTATFGEKHRLAFGAEREQASANDSDTQINGYFGLYEVKPVSTITISGGVRLDDHSTFGEETTLRAAALWTPFKFLTLKGSWGEGFKAPTIFQLTQTFGLLPPNADLLPETSEAYDIGFDFAPSAGRFKISLSYFNRDTENEITFAPNFRYENLEKTTAQGIETTIDIAVTDRVTLSANHAYIDAEDAITGERQIRIPKHSGDVSFIYTQENGVSGSLVVRYNGEETEGAFGSDVPAWIRVDLAASYPVQDNIELYGRIENLFDADYQQVSGFGTPGISGYGGVRLNF